MKKVVALILLGIVLISIGIYLSLNKTNKKETTNKKNYILVNGYKFSKLKIKSYDGNNIVYLNIVGNKMDNFKYFTLEFTIDKEKKIVVPFLISNDMINKESAVAFNVADDALKYKKYIIRKSSDLEIEITKKSYKIN